MTAAEVGRELGTNSANAAYHLRTLHTAGVIELAGEERIRGGLAKRYRYDAGLHAARAFADGGAPEPDRAVYAAIAGELGRRGPLAEASSRCGSEPAAFRCSASSARVSSYCRCWSSVSRRTPASFSVPRSPRVWKWKSSAPAGRRERAAGSREAAGGSGRNGNQYAM